MIKCHLEHLNPYVLRVKAPPPHLPHLNPQAPLLLLLIQQIQLGAAPNTSLVRPPLGGECRCDEGRDLKNAGDPGGFRTENGGVGFLESIFIVLLGINSTHMSDHVTGHHIVWIIMDPIPLWVTFFS